MEIYAIFEGGGAKGIGHVGALSALHYFFGNRIAGVAGTSAGAIVAALLAVGYRPSELFDEATGTGLLATDLEQLVGRQQWDRYEWFRERTEQLLSGSSLGNCLRLAFQRKYRRAVSEFAERRGLLATDIFRDQFEAWLQRKVQPGPTGKVLFSDLPANGMLLKIVAADLDEKKPVVFSAQDTPDVAIADAVAASIAIPFVFRPVTIEVNSKRRTLVDGGVVSNFPAWVFDRERRRDTQRRFTIGFQLAEKKQAPPAGAKKDSNGPTTGQVLGKHALAILDAVLSGDHQIHIRSIDDLHTCVLQVPVSTLQLKLSPEQKLDIYRTAKTEAELFLRGEVIPRHPDILDRSLMAAENYFRKASGYAAQHLRISLLTRTSRDTLRMAGSYGFEVRDTDDRMEFEIDRSLCGTCWNSRQIELLDVNAVRSAGQQPSTLTKYEAALIRRSVISIACVPVLNPSSMNNAAAASLLGVLAFDSDNLTVADFTRQAAQEAAVGAAGIVAYSLI